MTVSKKAILALVFVFATSSTATAAQRDNIDLQLLLQQPPFAPTRKFEKPLNHLKGGGAGKFPPIHPNQNENDEESVRRRLSLSTAVHYPNPCLELPANRVPEFNSANPANEGWSLALPAIDDGSWGILPLLFPLTLNGHSYSEISVDNNGALNFPPISPFPIPQFLDVFFANVDTRGTNGINGGYVWRKAIGTNKYAVAWDNVGYSPAQTDKLNTFQVIISDGTDASMGLGNNVCYCYGDMQWTTNNLGLVGVSLGNGFDSWFGRFSETGAAYDGGYVYGSEDGFDYLDNKSICFKVSGSNIPPVAVNVPENNRVDLDCGESVNNMVIFFLAPEPSQPVVSLMTSGASAGLTVDISNQTNQATATINWLPTATATVNVTLTATDGIDTTTVSVTFAASGPSCCQGTTAEIWNPRTNKFVQALVNGSKYCLKKYNLRAVPCQTEPVMLRLWNRRTKITLKRKKDYVPPYFLWGDKVNATGYVDVKPNPKVLPNGNYALSIKVINATNVTSPPNSVVEIRFKQACP